MKAVDVPQNALNLPDDMYSQLTATKKYFVIGLLLALFLAILAAIVIGSASVGSKEVFQVILSRIIPSYSGEYSALAETIILDLRLPRVFLAVLAGFCLAGSGAVMQGVLRNPLADPYILGISAGASFGAALAVVFGANILQGLGISSIYMMITNAFIFGLLTMLMIYGIASLKGAAPETLILAGVALGYLFSAGVSLLKYVSSHEQLRELTVWLMGGLWVAKWEAVLILLPITVGCLIFLLRYAWDLNALSAGEEVAANLGVNVKILRRNCAIFASLLASATVAFTGIIGFIGLVSPHVCRFIIGNDNRFLIPCSCLMGALLLLAADTLSRTMVSPTEIPVGIITSLIGVPFFLYLLFKQSRRWWG
jgi:iron complex transport system permease protein